MRARECIWKPTSVGKSNVVERARVRGRCDSGMKASWGELGYVQLGTDLQSETVTNGNRNKMLACPWILLP
jgi:hypothetical protein